LLASSVRTIRLLRGGLAGTYGRIIISSRSTEPPFKVTVAEVCVPGLPVPPGRCQNRYNLETKKDSFVYVSAFIAGPAKGIIPFNCLVWAFFSRSGPAGDFYP
jgi:hypothetical protein